MSGRLAGLIRLQMRTRSDTQEVTERQTVFNPQTARQAQPNIHVDRQTALDKG